MFNTFLSVFSWLPFGKFNDLFGWAIIVLLAIIILILFIKFPFVRKLIYKLIRNAEILVKQSGQGETKKALVVKWIYERIPNFLKWFITENYISQLIDKYVQEMNDWIKYKEEEEKLIK